MTFETALGAIRKGDADADRLGDLADLALAEGEEERALPWLAHAAARGGNARLWQWTALLQRALDRHQDALASFAQAARFAPSDPGIAHGRAQVAFEAGLDAGALFDHARRLAPANGDLLVGQAAARLAAGRGEAAAAELDAILAQVPLWLQGHVQLAQLRAILGQRGAATAALERALIAQPAEAALWRCLFDLRVRGEDFEMLAVDVEKAKAAGQGGGVCAEYAAIAAAETGAVDRADALFDAAPAAVVPGLAIWRIRHLLRTARIDAALPLIDDALRSDRAAAVWPYAAVAWRLAGDPRSAWLEGDARSVAVIDVREALPERDRLAGILRALHVAKGEYLDQSVRGGTQTDGPLFSRIDPAIRAVRDAVERAVVAHVAGFPQADRGHPLFGPRRDRRVRFAGSWSVRLGAAGHHANHVHPQGWISSALYVSLPPRPPGAPTTAGWLALGAPQAALGLGLPPTRLIEPREGQLVLFPSWMWHGTLPFAQGERLTVAFDVAPPR